MPDSPCLFVACAPSGSRIHPPYVKLFRKNCPAESTRIVERPKNQGPEQLPLPVIARRKDRSARPRVRRARPVGGHTRSSTSRCVSCERDVSGRIKCDPAARREFQRQHPCPATGKTARACPGYAVDHIMPLKRGGLAIQGLRIHNPFNNLAGLGI